MESVHSFKLRYAEFKDVDADLIQVVMDEAALSVDKRIYHGKYEAALYALCAHLLSNLSVMEEASGGLASGIQQVLKEKAGEVEINYQGRVSMGNALDDSFMNTVYGQIYLRLKDEVKPKIAVMRHGFRFP